MSRSLRNNDYVFGGLQVIVGGDFWQLKSVPNNAYRDPGEYCFLSEAWKYAMYHIIVLNTVLLQVEPLLISAIKDLSTGYLSQESVAFLNSLSCPLPTACQPTFLYARNYDVMLACFDFLCELRGKEKSYQSADEGKVKELYSLKVPKVLVLNNNSKVMLTVNLSNKLENGSLGVIHGPKLLHSESPWCRISKYQAILLHCVFAGNNGQYSKQNTVAIKIGICNYNA